MWVRCATRSSSMIVYFTKVKNLSCNYVGLKKKLFQRTLCWSLHFMKISLLRKSGQSSAYSYILNLIITTSLIFIPKFTNVTKLFSFRNLQLTNWVTLKANGFRTLILKSTSLKRYSSSISVLLNPCQADEP